MSRKCKVCRATFEPKQAFQTWCSVEHGVVIATGKLAKVKQVAAVNDKREVRAKLDKMKSRGKYIAEAQAAFNAFVRERDRQAGHVCISSGKPLDWTGNAVDAGHYRSRGSAPHLRFDERNCHAQSKHDNRYAAGNVVGYRGGLIQRIGLAAVEALEADQAPRRHSIDDLKALKAEYTAKTKQLKANA